MKEGDVIIVSLLQADGAMKGRPALILREMPPFQDLLVCGISTQLKQAAKDFDEVMAVDDADFSSSGLKAESLIRLGFLSVVPRRKIAGSIGLISPDRHHRLLKRLSDYLLSQAT